MRQELHRFPEMSNQEHQTSQRLLDWLKPTLPDELIRNLGGKGVAAVYRGKKPGPRVLLRCDMDALPIQEPAFLPNCSQTEGVSHKCGHDGHMAILLGLAQQLLGRRPKSGEVVLLFQPAEETGEGAKRVLEDPKFESIHPDWVFGMHNLPGFKLGEVVLRHDCFASASRGFIIQLTGHTSHAAEPEHGNSPVNAVAELLNAFTHLPATAGDRFGPFVKSTVIHAKMGEVAFGTTPGEATVMVTLRTHRNEDMDRLADYSKGLAQACADKHKLALKTMWTEEFPACENDPEAVDLLKRVVKKNKQAFVEPQSPFNWSEDFGHFLMYAKGAIFGMGSGIECPPLHHPNYLFPDALIPTAIETWLGIIEELCG